MEPSSQEERVLQFISALAKHAIANPVANFQAVKHFVAKIASSMSYQSISEGSVSFPSRPGSTYRYKITTTSDSASFWLEDRKTKSQWYV